MNPVYVYLCVYYFTVEHCAKVYVNLVIQDVHKWIHTCMHARVCVYTHQFGEYLRYVCSVSYNSLCVQSAVRTLVAHMDFLSSNPTLFHTIPLDISRDNPYAFHLLGKQINLRLVNLGKVNHPT